MFDKVNTFYKIRLQMMLNSVRFVSRAIVMNKWYCE